jgi:hypothetical protein
MNGRGPFFMVKTWSSVTKIFPGYSEPPKLEIHVFRPLLVVET